MSYPTPPQQPPPSPPPERARPTTVTAATWLLVLVAVVYLIGAVALLSQVGTFNEVFREAYEGTDLEGQEAIGTISTVAGGAFNILFAIGFLVLAILDYQGKNPARIVTWVVGGVALCCNGLGLALTGAMEGMQLDGNGGPDPTQIQRDLEAALPGWFDAITWISTIGGILGLIGALILLALPPSNEFFRKQPPPFEPPPPPYPQATQ